MRKYRIESGFTLIEITIAFAILSVTMLAAVLAYVGISRLQQQGVNVRLTQQDSRFAIEQMAREIRGSTAATVGNGGTTLTLANSQFASANGTITYQLDTAQLQVDRIDCTPNNTPPPANFCTTSVISGPGVRVTSLAFSYFDGVDVVCSPLNDDSCPIPVGRPTIKIDMEVRQSDSSLDALVTNAYHRTYDLSTIVEPRLY